MSDPIEKLARDDKWQLGAGDGTVFAPAFPRWLESPGFWDGVSVLARTIAPLFTVTVLDAEGREISARVTARRWTPAELTLQYRLGQGITATEVRTVQPGGIFVSEWRFAAYRPEHIHLVAWTAQPGIRVDRNSARWNGALSFTVSAFGGDRTAPPRRSTDASIAPPVKIRAELACVGGAESWSTARSEGLSPDPSWRITPFVEEWRGGSLSKKIALELDVDLTGTFFAAVHRPLDVEYGGASATFAMRVIADDPELRQPETPMPPGARPGTFGAASRQRWGDYFAGVPAFRCSDPYLETIALYQSFTARLRGATMPQAPSASAAEKLIADRDADGTGLFDVPSDDPSLEVRGHNIKGVDASVRAYKLFRALEHSGDGAARWAALAAITLDAVRSKMWDKKTGMFSDVHADTLKRTKNRTAHCFLPYGTDIADDSHIAGLEKHLLNPREFFTAFPVPSLAADDTRFSAEGEHESRRAAAPWNGRNHVALSGEVADALAHAARTLAPALRDSAAALIRRLIRTMFHDGDLRRANAHDHYNPFTGHASLYRGADDIHLPFINDLIVRHVMGVLETENGITVDPLDFQLEYAELTGLKIRDRSIGVLIEGEKVTVTVNGEKHESVIGLAAQL